MGLRAFDVAQRRLARGERMTKWTARRERAFLMVLRESCNVTLACERTRVSRGRAYRRRGGNAAFAAAWDAALREGEARIAARGCAESPGDMVARGSRGRPVQIARARACRFTPRKQAAFLAHLAETANVRAALRAAGIVGVSVYRHRARWPAFAQAWDEALEQAYTRIEVMLIERATNVVEDPSTLLRAGGDAEASVVTGGAAACTPAEFDPYLALNILKAHWRRVDRGMGVGARRGGRAPRPPSLEEVEASLLAKLDALDRHRAWKQARAGGSPAPSSG